MDVTIGIEEHVIWFDIAVYDALSVNVSEGAAELGDPKPHCVLGKGLSGNVKSQIAAAHQINHQVPVFGSE